MFRLIIFILLSANLTNGQTIQLTKDSLKVSTVCLGGSYDIIITKNYYSRKTSNVFLGNSDTLIILTDKQVKSFNSQLKKIEDIKSKNRVRKINHSCPCYRNLIIYESNNERDLGTYISSKPPCIFKTINKIIEEIE